MLRASLTGSPGRQLASQILEISSLSKFHLLVREPGHSPLLDTTSSDYAPAQDELKKLAEKLADFSIRPSD